MARSDFPDVVKHFTRRVFVVSAMLGVGAAVASPLWAWGRPDRAWGFALGAAASLAKFAWSVRIVRRLGEMSARQCAVERMMSLALLGVALVIAGMVDGIDLPAAAVGVFLATVASVTAAVWLTRRAPDTGSTSAHPAEATDDAADGIACRGKQ